MRLLLLTASESPIPSLELLGHELIRLPLGEPLHALAHPLADPAVARAIIVDGRADPIAARSAAVTLAGRTHLPRIALLGEASLAAVSPEWEIADFCTPAASPAELSARLDLALRAQALQLSGAAADDALSATGVEIDESSFIARVQGRTLDLTYKEFELLNFLARHPSRVFTRDQLLSQVWGTDYFGGTRTVDVHVRRLRAKLGEHEWLISTVRGVGYGFARGRNEEGQHD